MKQQLRPGIERAGLQMTRRSVLTGTLGLLAACASNASASQDEFTSRIEAQQLLVGDALAATSRAQLIAWMSKSQTGLRRLRAGLPRTWSAGDKTGTGSNGAVNDVMIAWPPGRQPVMAAVYLSEASTTRDELEDAHAQIGALIVELIG